MSKLIPPTPGRVVWYYPSQHEIDAKQIAIYDQGQPLAATVAYVFSDRLVNLSVVDQAGAQFRRTSVKLLQEDDPVPHTSEGPYAEWMPFQKAQHETAAEADASQTPVVVVDPAAPGADQTVQVTAISTETKSEGDAPATTDTSATNAGAQLAVPSGDANQPEGQPEGEGQAADGATQQDRKSTRLNSSH